MNPIRKLRCIKYKCDGNQVKSLIMHPAHDLVYEVVSLLLKTGSCYYSDSKQGIQIIEKRQNLTKSFLQSCNIQDYFR